MRWGFRVATRPEVGGGHLLRCLALADALPDPVTIFTDPGHSWAGRIAAAGCGEVREPEADGMTACTDAVRSGAIDALLIDGYGFRDADIRAVTARVFTVEIDDVLQPPRTAVVINPGAADDTGPYGATDSLILCGPRYALLGPRFADAHKGAVAAPTPGRVRRILISMGARDSADATSAALEACRRIGREIPVTVVMGGTAPHLPKLRRLTEPDPHTTLLVDHDDMASLYLCHDLAFGAGGISLLERMCCGLPTIVVCQADNQRRNIDAAEALGAATAVETADRDLADGLAAALARLVDGPDRLDALRRAGLAAVDGQGARRTASRLEQALTDRMQSR